MDAELKVAESSRYGAPMTLVRSGEDRDLAAIAAMGEARASQFRFHLDRDRLKNAATVTSLAHVSAPSFKHSSRVNQWNNGRSSTGGRRLASCLPRSRSSRRGPSKEVMLGRFLTGVGKQLRLSREEVLYWRSDVF